jgi:hypothetical protein
MKWTLVQHKLPDPAEAFQFTDSSTLPAFFTPLSGDFSGTLCVAIGPYRFVPLNGTANSSYSTDVLYERRVRIIPFRPTEGVTLIANE